MFTEPKRGNGLNESPICYATKKLWAIVCYYEIYEDITFKYFIEHIEHFIEKYKFDWPEGKPYPKYTTACLWPSKYDYKECVQCYENKKLKYDKDKADKIYDKKYLKDTLSDFKNYDAYERQIQKELAKETPNPSEIEKWEHLKEKSMNRNDRRSGRDIQKIEKKVVADINSDVTVNLLDKVKKKRRELNDSNSN